MFKNKPIKLAAIMWTTLSFVLLIALGVIDIWTPKSQEDFVGRLWDTWVLFGLIGTTVLWFAVFIKGEEKFPDF